MRIRPFTVPLAVAAALAVAACGSGPARRDAPGGGPAAASGAGKPPASVAAGKRGGGYYLDDGPGDSPPPNLDLLPDAVPKVEKYASGANRPYNVFGVDYVPDLSGAPYRQRGTGSWYGRKFHGQRTSSGEIYDMYAMTAAHPTLPIPCYALVTNLVNGKSVIVRVNDRGPFLHNRIMDLSYAAASKVGYLSSGSGQIEVEMLMPADIAAGRIPLTTNSVYLAQVAAGGAREPVTVARSSATLPAPAALDAIVTTVAAAPVVATPPAVPSATPSAASSGSASRSASSFVGAGGLPAAGPDATTGALAASPGAPVAGPSRRIEEPALPMGYADRGIPADLIPDAQPPAKLPELATAAGFYLQLGAFRARAGADSFAAHVTREIDPALASKVHVADANGLFRVRVGPYARRAEADSAATNLRAAIAQPVLVLPEGAVR